MDGHDDLGIGGGVAGDMSGEFVDVSDDDCLVFFYGGGADPSAHFQTDASGLSLEGSENEFVPFQKIEPRPVDILDRLKDKSGRVRQIGNEVGLSFEKARRIKGQIGQFDRVDVFHITFSYRSRKKTGASRIKVFPTGNGITLSSPLQEGKNNERRLSEGRSERDGKNTLLIFRRLYLIFIVEVFFAPGEYIMEERFKSYLETAFRTISPTKAAMEYRKRTLKKMLDRAQELKIKGMTDEELVIETVLEDYADFCDELKDFEKKEVKTNAAKRNAFLGVVVAVAAVVLLSLTYVLIGVLTHVWHPTWLLIVCGVFLGLFILFVFLGVKSVRGGKYLLLRLLAALCEILPSVLVFLFLLLVFGIENSWLTFLAMVVLLFGTDAAIAFFTLGKGRWIELPVFVEVFAVMLYVTLGVLLPGFWHPGWLLCLIGPVFALVETVILVAVRNDKKNKKEKALKYEKYVKTDESYWSKWDE